MKKNLITFYTGGTFLSTARKYDYRLEPWLAVFVALVFFLSFNSATTIPPSVSKIKKTKEERRAERKAKQDAEAEAYRLQPHRCESRDTFQLIKTWSDETARSFAAAVQSQPWRVAINH